MKPDSPRKGKGEGTGTFDKVLEQRVETVSGGCKEKRQDCLLRMKGRKHGSVWTGKAKGQGGPSMGQAEVQDHSWRVPGRRTGPFMEVQVVG